MGNPSPTKPIGDSESTSNFESVDIFLTKSNSGCSSGGLGRGKEGDNLHETMLTWTTLYIRQTEKRINVTSDFDNSCKRNQKIIW